MGVIDWIILAVSVLIFGASGLTVLYNVFFGLGKTNLNNKYIWGLNIQGFFVLSSIGSGILAVLSIAVIFQELLAFSLYRFQLAATIAFACLLSAQMLMGADLGRPFRALKIISGKNFISPLTLDFISLVILTILSFVFMFGIFMNIPEVMRLWAFATLFFTLFCMLVHVLLFVMHLSGSRIKSFDALITVANGIWSGTAVMSLLTLNDSNHHVFFNSFLVLTLLIFVSQIGSIISAFLAEQKPHNLIFTGISFIILVFLLGHGIIFREILILEIAICLLAIVALFIEKFEMVIGFQREPVLPPPYSMYEQPKPYRPSFFEIGNLIAALSFTVVVTYGVLIIRVYLLPFIIGLFT
ncbi:MAG: hypothetical protein FWG66_12830 [Spirochaetes bacterium]|nr:hypothetical protein [Spirochaetota bacterium]